MSTIYKAAYVDDNPIIHWRTKGSKNGVRLWQNPDGSYTEAGRNSKPGGRYNQNDSSGSNSVTVGSSTWSVSSSNFTVKRYEDSAKVYDSKYPKYVKNSSVAYPDKQLDITWCDWEKLCRKEKVPNDPAMKLLDDKFDEDPKYRPDKSEDAFTRNVYYSWLVRNGITGSPDGWDPISYMETNYYTKEYQSYLDKYFDQDNMRTWMHVLELSGTDRTQIPYASYTAYLGIKAPAKQYSIE